MAATMSSSDPPPQADVGKLAVEYLVVEVLYVVDPTCGFDGGDGDDSVGGGGGGGGRAGDVLGGEEEAEGEEEEEEKQVEEATTFKRTKIRIVQGC